MAKYKVHYSAGGHLVDKTIEASIIELRGHEDQWTDFREPDGDLIERMLSNTIRLIERVTDKG